MIESYVGCWIQVPESVNLTRTILLGQYGLILSNYLSNKKVSRLSLERTY